MDIYILGNGKGNQMWVESELKSFLKRKSKS